MLVLFIALGLLLRASPVAAKSTASDGFLDLSSYSFADQGSVSLDGYWAFYWEQLLEPADVRLKPPTAFLPVPGGWNGAQVNGHSLPPDGYATYHLQVKVADPHRSYALSIPYMSTAYRLWVDGEPVAANGTVGTSAATSRPASRYTPCS